jgi:hypothetical protein
VTVTDHDLPGEFAAHMAAVARGEKPLPSSTGDRHHFVPEFVLRRFRGRTSKGKRLFVLDKTDGSIEESSPKAAGYVDRLYSLNTVDGQHDGFIEGVFALAENYAAKPLEMLQGVHPNPSLRPSDRGNIAYLIAAQQQRVPSALEDLRANMIIAASTFAAVEMANTKGSKRERRRGVETYEAMVGGELSLQPSADAVLEQAFISLGNTAQTIFRLPWTLFRARPDPGNFVCSDQPLTMYDPSPPHKFSAPGWISSENVAAALPISSSACLRISPRDRLLFSVRPTSRHVDRINRFTYGFASRWVYGSSRQLLESLHHWAQSAPGEVPAPIPKRLVLLEEVATADPAVAEANAARGWDRYLAVRQNDGSERLMSYEVIDSLDDAMKAIAPQSGRHLASLDHISPPDVGRRT